MENHSFLSSILHWFVSGVALLFTAYLVKGFAISGFVSALIAAAVIGLANAVLWPILIFLTLPINVLTLGLFTFVVNGMVLKICAALLPGFAINTWFAAIFGSIILTVVSGLMHAILV